MKKYIIVISLFTSFITFSQEKQQKIGFVDMEYVLQKIPSFSSAQTKLEETTKKWKAEIGEMYQNVATLEKELINDTPLLTEELIKEREHEIKLAKQDIGDKEQKYYGPEGELFKARVEMVTPFQDMVYNAVNQIAERKKFDFIFEKTSGPTVIYTNKNSDISDLVLKYITRTIKEIEQEEAAEKRRKDAERRKKRREDLRRRIEEKNKRLEAQRQARLKKNK